MAKSSVHAPKESPPLPGLLISKESETLYPASQRKKAPSKGALLCLRFFVYQVYAISIRAWGKTYFIAETDLACIFMHRFVIFLLTSLLSASDDLP